MTKVISKTISSVKVDVKDGRVYWTARINLRSTGKRLFKDQGSVELLGKNKPEMTQSIINAKEEAMKGIIAWEKDNTDPVMTFK